MSLNEDRRLNPIRGESLQSGEPVMPNAPLSVAAGADLAPATAGEATSTGVSPQSYAFQTDKPAVTSDISERQAVEVRPMRYVLFVGLGLAIIAMLVAWALFR